MDSRIHRFTVAMVSLFEVACANASTCNDSSWVILGNSSKRDHAIFIRLTCVDHITAAFDISLFDGISHRVLGECQWAIIIAQRSIRVAACTRSIIHRVVCSYDRLGNTILVFLRNKCGIKISTGDSIGCIAK